MQSSTMKIQNTELLIFQHQLNKMNINFKISVPLHKDTLLSIDSIDRTKSFLIQEIKRLLYQQSPKESNTINTLKLQAFMA